MADQPAAVPSCAGADVDHMVRGLDGVLVVFDNHDGVAGGLQFLDRREQPVVVSGMQSNRRFVQDVADADQAAADAGGQTDTLHFAAAERFR